LTAPAPKKIAEGRKRKASIALGSDDLAQAGWNQCVSDYWSFVSALPRFSVAFPLSVQVFFLTRILQA
jgi:hypothetical protein